MQTLKLTIMKCLGTFCLYMKLLLSTVYISDYVKDSIVFAKMKYNIVCQIKFSRYLHSFNARVTSDHLAWLSLPLEFKKTVCNEHETFLDRIWTKEVMLYLTMPKLLSFSRHFAEIYHYNFVERFLSVINYKVKIREQF